MDATAKDQLHALVDSLSDEEAELTLRELSSRFAIDEEPLTDEELAPVEQGFAQIRCGDYVILDQLKQRFGA